MTSLEFRLIQCDVNVDVFFMFNFFAFPFTKNCCSLVGFIIEEFSNINSNNLLIVVEVMFWGVQKKIGINVTRSVNTHKK